MSADSYNSDDERYADETFEQESDTDVPEAVEIESEISEASDADQDDDSLPTAKINTVSSLLNYIFKRKFNNYSQMKKLQLWSHMWEVLDGCQRIV